MDDKKKAQQDYEDNREDFSEQMQPESEEVAQLKEKLADTEGRYKRALADYQNLQRRTYEQKSEWIKSANKELLLKILPVLDTLMLAGKHITDKGLSISIDQFIKILEQEGLQRIKTVGEEFNPHTMEAIATKEGESGKVIEEVRVGFMLYGSVLRTAQVIVGKQIGS
jgi:molecular chaperone GrpE